MSSSSGPHGPPTTQKTYRDAKPAKSGGAPDSAGAPASDAPARDRPSKSDPPGTSGAGPHGPPDV